LMAIGLTDKFDVKERTKYRIMENASK
jgi:hypothetical protein